MEEPSIGPDRENSATFSRVDNRWGFNNRFTMEELDRAVRACRDKSSPGMDGIDYKMIKLCTAKFKECLLECINFSFNLLSGLEAGANHFYR